MKPQFASASILAALLVAATFSPSIAGPRGPLTPEERVLYAQHMHSGLRGLPLQQRCARLQQIRAERRSMTPAARAQLKQQLAAQWAALPAAEKQRIEQRIADRRTRRADRPQQEHARRC